MSKNFNCNHCSNEIIIKYIKPNDLILCKFCSKKTPVPNIIFELSYVSEGSMDITFQIISINHFKQFNNKVGEVFVVKVAAKNSKKEKIRLHYLGW